MQDEIGALGRAFCEATREKTKPHPGIAKLKSRTEPKDLIISLPVRVWHQVETFDDLSERHSIKHPDYVTVFTGASFAEAFRHMKETLSPY